MSEISLQEEYENLQTSCGLNKSKEIKQTHKYTSSLVQWATMPWLEEAPLYLTQQWRSYGSMGKMSG